MEGPEIRIDPAFAEALTFPALRVLEDAGAPEPLAAHHARAGEIFALLDDPIARERRFADLARAEVAELRLLEPIGAALGERPALAAQVELILVAEAAGSAAEGVTCDGGRRTLGIRVLARRFDKPALLRAWCRHAFGHAEDTLDPSFGYEAGWERALDGGPAERLHALWDVSIDGRAAAADRPCAGASPERHKAALAALLPGGWGSVAGPAVEVLWRGPRPAFPELRAWALDPAALAAAVGCEPSVAPGTRLPAGRCPLCAFPSATLAIPPAAIADAIRAEYPAWRPERGVCERCLDRYILAPLGGLQ